MTAEPLSASLVSRFSSSETSVVPQGYFRSKLFVSSSSSNPLVAAANPLLSLLERLNVTPHLPAVQILRGNIEHELLAFHSRMTSAQYAHEFISIAHYLLCATIDELLGKNYVRLHGQPAEFIAFTPSSTHDQNPQYEFFNIMRYLKERTHQYLDILELAYYCLITGFEGEYHQRADGRQRLDHWIDELHQLIQQHRVHKPYRLFKEPHSIKPQTKGYKSLFIFTATTLSAMILLFFTSRTLLEYQAHAVLVKNTPLFTWIMNG